MAAWMSAMVVGDRAVNVDVKRALERDRTIDITTIGRRTGRPRRIEIWFHRVDGRLYITGTPGRRGWYANLLHHREFTFHLKGGVRADLQATATPIVDLTERRGVLSRILAKLGASRQLEAWVAGSPLVEVALVEAS
ncbi:MAG: nitroreductase/quinone reductase family protein [Thermoplasmata archaeon]